ncbi:unnamed protein product [Rhizophagus irregularis]|nr:unnamed protein product [Rhizophagus irregularis]
MSGVKCENIKVFYKWCKQFETNKLRKNFTNWTSGNEKVDNFIQEKQLETNNSRNIVFEWIPYNKFLDIKEVDKDDFSTVYFAKWEDGPLEWNNNSIKYVRNQKEFGLKLKYSHNLQNVVEFLNEVKVYSTNFEIFGISQNPDKKNYIMALQDKDYCILCKNEYIDKWCKQCDINKLRKNFTNWTSGNEKIDNFIQEKQLEINDPGNIVFEWIPYNKFLDIKEVDKDDFSTIYSAKWEDGPLKLNYYSRKYVRNQKEFGLKLKYSHNLQNVVEFLNEVKVHSTNFNILEYLKIQIKRIILCGNEKIDNFIQEKQLEINYPRNIVFEWIPYNKFLDIKEVDKDDFSTVYSAKWEDGPLKFNHYSRKYIRNQKEFELKLKYSHNIQNVVEFLNKVKVYSTNFNIFGISQNSDTKNYIMVLQDKDYCIVCQNIYTDEKYKWCKTM